MAEIDREQIDKEVLPFLTLDSKPQLRCIAMQYFLGLTGTEDGRSFIASNENYLEAIVNLLDDQPGIAVDAYMSLVNLSTEGRIVQKLLEVACQPNLVIRLIKYVLQADSFHADTVCMILSNLSRPEFAARQIVQTIIDSKDDIGFDKIIQVFCLENFNSKAQLHYLGPFLSNLTQIPEARKYVLDKEHCVIQRLLAYTEYSRSLVRRGGIVGTLRNCCFETEYHEWLLSDSVDILPRLLLPLAGPEEFDEDDMERLPDDLQYLAPDKKREVDPDIRKMLVEAIHQLCATKHCRMFIKEKNTYVILRELHKWEKDPAAIAALESLVSLLIGDEPEAGMENLKQVQIPEHIEVKLKQADEKMKEEIVKETMNMEK